MADKVKTRKINKGGRPPLPDDERRNHRVEFWLNDAEFADLIYLCEQSGMSKGELVRSLIFKKPIRWMKIPAINRQAYAELGRIGANVNQLSRSANTYGYSDQAGELAELHQIIQQIRRELLGVSDDSQG